MSGWFAVRCLFRCGWASEGAADSGNSYEERITVWKASNMDEAIAKAEAEAHVYAAEIEEPPSEYLGLAQVYALFDDPDQDGAEVFSLIRDSHLDASNYLDAFFDTGHERQGSVTEGPD